LISIANKTILLPFKRHSKKGYQTVTHAAFEKVEQFGYRITRIMQDGPQFVSAQGRSSDGAHVFVKATRPGESKRDDRLRNECLYFANINTVRLPTVKCPRVTLQIPGAYAADWISGYHLWELEEPEQIHAVTTVARALAELDRQFVVRPYDKQRQPITTPYFGHGTGRTFEHGPPAYEHQFKAVSSGFPTPEQMEQVDDNIRLWQISWRIGLQHCDIIPQNLLFEDTYAEEVYILDAEHASFFAPRLQDVVRFYHKLAIGYSFQLAGKFLRQFCNYSGLENRKLVTQFCPMIGRQAIGAMCDAFLDHQEGRRDYREAARTLLEWSINGQANNFLGTD
jgi:hypothetical protein